VDCDLADQLGVVTTTRTSARQPQHLTISENKKMNANINQATIPTLVNDETQTGTATHMAQYAMLNELPGVVFGLLTLAWIVTSLFGLV
jgi:hypothetical protein